MWHEVRFKNTYKETYLRSDHPILLLQLLRMFALFPKKSEKFMKPFTHLSPKST